VKVRFAVVCAAGHPWPGVPEGAVFPTLADAYEFILNVTLAGRATLGHGLPITVRAVA
jgi:hypothetical protein